MTSMRGIAIVLLSSVALGCVGGDPAAAGAAAQVSPAANLAALAAEPPRFRTCRSSARAPKTARGFDHKRSALVGMGDPNHSMQDVVAAPGATVAVAAKITYGDAGKDLEDETVEVFLDDCAELVAAGSGKTNDDGIATVSVTAPASPCAYAMTAWVPGDGSYASATLHVLPPGTELVVFDIDGTLTTDDAEVSRDVLDEHFGHIADGHYRAAAYAHGAALAKLWRDRGFVILYLTGRPYWLADHSRAWLRDEGFPEGIVRTTLRHRDVVPKVDGVGRFKADVLRDLIDRRYRVVAAHGNATTDVWAYAQVGIPTDRTFIIGPHAGDGGTVAVKGDWSAVLDVAKAHRVAAQPFAAE
jgi:hypothetical protein